MQPISIVIFGMSHANALKRALASYTARHEGVSIHVALNGNAAYPGGLVVYDQHGAPMITPLLQRAINQQMGRKDNPAVWVVSALGGNEANRLSLIKHPVAFDFIDPEAPETPVQTGASILPYDVTRDLMAEKLENVATALGLIKSLNPVGIVQLGPIPPIRDDAAIKGLLPPRTIEAARERGAADQEIEINPSAARLRMWKLEQAVTRTMCSELDLHFLEPSNPLIGEDGMRDADSAADAIHGNDLWGAEMLAQIENYVVSQQEMRDGRQ